MEGLSNVPKVVQLSGRVKDSNPGNLVPGSQGACMPLGCAAPASFPMSLLGVSLQPGFCPHYSIGTLLSKVSMASKSPDFILSHTHQPLCHI